MTKAAFFSVAVMLASLAAGGSANAEEASGAAPTVSPEPQQDPPPRRKKARLGAKLAGGATYRTLYSSSLTAGTVDLGLGVEFAPGALYGTFGAVVGTTKYGLATQTYSFGPTWEFRFDRVRFGAGLQVGYMQIARVTKPDQRMGTMLGGAQIFLTVDVFPFDGHAIYLGARLSVDSAQGNEDAGAFIGGPTIFAGFRY